MSDAQQPGAVDYARWYEEYWSREDRWGSHSFDDADEICAQILSTCGAGRTLDVGCGMGLLVRTLLRRGVDAHGVDIAKAPVEEANRLAPGRFSVASILDLPFEDGAFATVVSTDVLEHIAEEDVERAIAELARVCSGSCFVRIATTPDRDRRWHLTIRDRQWWLQRFLDAGFRRHPLAHRVVDFDRLDSEGWQTTLVLERCPAHGAVADDPLHAADAQSEAQVARCARCLGLIRPNELVLDVSGSTGWSAAMVDRGTLASRIVAVVRDEEAASRLRTSTPDARIEAVCDDAGLLDQDEIGGVPVGGFHAVLAMGRFAAPEEARSALPSLARWVCPGGRIVLDLPCSASHDALETPGFLIESLAIQQDGSEDPGSGAGRQRGFVEVHPGDEAPEGSWTVVVLMRDPAPCADVPYQERDFPEHLQRPGFHVANFERDLDNPWLARSMIARGLRSSNREVVAEIASRTLESARPGSSDEGAALCVLGYRLLESDTPDPERVDELLARIEQYQRRADDTPYAHRWRISTEYVAGRLLMARGRMDEAYRRLRACAELDPLVFSPLLASKTVDALFHAGLIRRNAGDPEAARDHWQHALRQFEQAVKSDWLNVWGSSSKPLRFAHADLIALVDAAGRCIGALHALETCPDRAGLAWTLTNPQTTADMRSWIERMERARRWLARQASWHQRHAGELQRQLHAARARIGTLQEQVDRAKDDHARQVGDMRRRLEDQQELIDRQRAQIASLQARVEELRRWSASLTKAREFLQGQVAYHRQQRALAQERAQKAHEHAAKARDHASDRIERLERANAWLREQVEHLRIARDRARERSEKSEAWARRTSEGVAFWRAQHEAARTQLGSARASIARLREEKERAVGFLRERLASMRSAKEFWQDACERTRKRAAWLEQQLEKVRESRDRQVAWLEQQIARLRESRDRQVAWLEARDERRKVRIEELLTHIRRLERGLEFHKAQSQHWRERAMGKTDRGEDNPKDLRACGKAATMGDQGSSSAPATPGPDGSAEADGEPPANSGPDAGHG